MKKEKTLYEKIINILLDILIFLFGFILLISIYNAIQVKIIGNDYPSFFGYSTFEVQTGSMGKAIDVGDWIIVDSKKKINLNDIVTYKQKQNYITHRVIEVYKDTLVTKGDANNTKDEAINRNQVVGKVVKVLPHFGIFKKTLFNPGVLIALIITLYLLNSILKSKVSKDEKQHFNKTKKLIKNIKFIKKKTPTIVINEIKSEPIENISNENISLKDLDETDDDLSKTICFRSVSVDASDLNDYGIKTDQIIEEPEIKKIKKEEDKNDYDSLAKEKLSLIKKQKNKKYKNIIDKIMDLKIDELNEIISILNNDSKVLINERSIKNSLLKAYIDARYYNYCGDVNTGFTSKTVVPKIKKIISEIGNELSGKYTGSDTKFNTKVDKYVDIISLIVSLEQAKELMVDLGTRRKEYSNMILKELNDETLINKNIIDEIIKTQKTYNKVYEYLLKKLETSKFSINYNQLFSKKSMFGLELNHNIEFSKVYSEYIVDKVYDEDIIAEDKIVVMLSILLAQLTRNMITMNFKKKYVIHIPNSLYYKTAKLNKIVNLMDDEFAKNSIIILTEYESFIKNYQLIRTLIKRGYKFSIYFNKDVLVKAKDIKYLYSLENIFINKKNANYEEIVKLMPEDLLNNIIYEDILSRVGNYRG